MFSCKRPAPTTTPAPEITSTTTEVVSTTPSSTIPAGIEKLNNMLDPNKTSERIRIKNASMETYREEFGSIDMTTSYPNFFEIMWYSQMPCYDVRGLTSKVKDEMSLIKRCLWKGITVNCAAIFDTRPTDRVMCCTFNMDNINDVFRESRYRDVVQTMQEKDSTNAFEETKKPDWYL